MVPLVPLGQLHPAPWNPRTIRDSCFQALCHAIEADPGFLWARPVCAQSSGEIYAGNMRWRAADSLGWTEIPAIIEDIDPLLAKERALRDNRSYGEDDDQAVAELLQELQEHDRDLDLTGFSNDYGLKLVRLADA